MNVDVSGFPRSLGKMGNFFEGLLEVGLDIVDMLNSNANTNEILRDARGDLFFVGELLVSRDGWGNDQLFISQILRTDKQSSHPLH